MSEEVVVSVKNIKKDFYLPNNKNDSIKRVFTQLFKKKKRGGSVHHALKDVSFDIKKGEFFGILGRNGSGKSTLLKIIAQIYRPTSGSVSVKGRLVPFIELGVGFSGELTGRENVYLNGAMLGFSKKEIDERYEEIVKFAELEKFMDQKLKNYSSGMKVRLAFSVAIQADADVLILDEVLAVGDAAFQRKCYEYFKSLKIQKKTIIFVTHNMGLAKEYCDRAVLIENGVITHEGNTSMVADEYLKLFSNKSEINNNKNGRWGDGGVIVNDVSVDVNDNIVSFGYELKSGNRIVDNIIIEAIIKDKSNKVIAGMDNINISSPMYLKFKKNEKKLITFDVPNIFSNTNYEVDIVVKSDGGVNICDSWQKAVEFSITKDDMNYPIICPANIKINSIK